MEIPIEVVALWGNEKTRKSSLALTFPGPLAFFDFDLGFQRAGWRFPEKDVRVYKYPRPWEMTVGNQLKGVREQWQEFEKNYSAEVFDSDARTLVMDTATQAWRVCHRGHLQTLQEGGSKRMNLLPVEYGVPNDLFKRLFDAVRGRDKILVVVHYEGDVYRDYVDDRGAKQSMATGEKKPDGFGDTPKMADMVVRTFKDQVRDVKTGQKSPVFKAEFTADGVTGQLEGMQMQDPTFEKIVALVKTMRTV